MEWNLYRDTIHGHTAAATSQSMAWALIRNKCHEDKTEVPTWDKIEFVRKLRESELQFLKNRVE